MQERFAKTLKLDKEHAIFPDFAQYAVAIGVSLQARELEKTYTCQSLITILEESKNTTSSNKYLEPLFASESDYNAFIARHESASVEEIEIEQAYKANNHHKIDVYIGIDCGSTTTKLVMLDSHNAIVYQYYNSNKGNPVEVISTQLTYIYEHFGDKINIKGSAVTGYGEDLGMPPIVTEDT